jgi:hypothetical protein
LARISDRAPFRKTGSKPRRLHIAPFLMPVVTYGIGGLHYDLSLINRKLRQVRRGLLRLKQAA